jgi:hypothetical protein
MRSPKVRVTGDHVRIGACFSVTFHRTLRIPDDGRVYPLPPGLGEFPLHRVADYRDRVPSDWKKSGGVFLPMYQREAMWLGFEGAAWKPKAVKVGVGRVNALSDAPWDVRLHDDPQDYLVCPDQPWLDGINGGNGFICQFVAMPLGAGYTVEGQLSGREEFGGIQLLVFEPKPGRFPDRPPPEAESGLEAMVISSHPLVEMGLSAGGKIKQKIYSDPYGVDTWDLQHRSALMVHIVNSAHYHELTGLPMPPTPVSAQTYAENSLPWFDLYDEDRCDVPAPTGLAGVKSVKAKDAERDRPAGEEETSLDLGRSPVRRLRRKRPGQADKDSP